MAIELPKNSELSEIIKNAVQILCQELDYDCGHWFVKGTDETFVSGKEWYISPSHNIHGNFKIGTEALQRKMGEGIIGRVLQNRKPLIVSNLRVLDFGRNKFIPDHPYKGALFIPAFYDEQLLFIIEIFSVSEKVNVESFDWFITSVCRDLEIHIDRILRIKNEIETLRTLAQNQRLSTLGLQVSTITHELKNPLTVISYVCQKIQIGLEDGLNNLKNENSSSDKISFPKHQIQQYIKSLSKASTQLKKANKIISGSRDLSRDASQDISEVRSAAELMDELNLFLEARFLSTNLRYHWNCEDVNIQWKARQSQIEQILHNLINNAIEAIKDLPEPWIRININKDNCYVYFSVTDCGKGIPSEIADKLMQPFFSTKGQRTGLGLGLNISRKLAQEMEGDLTIDSQCANTRFILKIPLHISEESKSQAS